MLGDTNSDPDESGANPKPADAPGTAVSRRVLRHGAKFDFEVVTVPDSSGKTLEREVVRHPGAVVILPLLDTPAGPHLVLIRNWRVALEQWLWELPAGTLERGEDPAACAQRELIEETGYRAATITPLGRFYTSPGFSDELMWAYVATGLTPGATDLEDDERVTVHPVDLESCFQMLERGELMDGKSALTLLRAARAGFLGAHRRS